MNEPSVLLRSNVSRRGLLAGFGALAVGSAVGAHGAAAAEKVSIALDWYPNANHAGLFLAQSRGLFSDAGFDVDLATPSDPTLVLQTVGAGRDTFGVSYQTDVLLARAQGVPVVSVAALVQHPLLAVMALASRSITRPRDLVGKTVGYPGIPSQEAFLATMLETDGAALSDVDLVNVGFNLLPAVISGQVDAVMGAYWTYETIVAERTGHPVTTLRVEEWGAPDYYELVLVASEETVKRRAATVDRVLAVVQAGYVAAIAEPEAALDAIVSAYPETDREVARQGIALLAPLWMTGVETFGEQTASRWRALGDWMRQRQLIPASLDIEAAFRPLP